MSEQNGYCLVAPRRNYTVELPLSVAGADSL